MKDIQDLKDNLQGLLKTAEVKNMRNEIVIGVKTRITPPQMSNILNNPEDIVFLSDKELYFLSKFMNKCDIKNKKDNINPNTYFTKVTMDNYEYSTPIVETEMNSYTFEDVTFMKNDFWSVAKIHIKDIDDLMRYSFFHYDPKQQRETIKSKKYSMEVVKSKTYSKSIEQIKDKMLSGNYFPDPIALNITPRDDGKELESFMYDEETRTLKIVKDDNIRLNLIDGMHRCKAVTQAINENPNLEGYLQVYIFHMSTEKAQEYIHQMSLKNDIDKRLTMSYNHSDTYVSLAHEILNYGNATKNLLYNKAGKTPDDMKNNVVMFSDFQYALKELFPVDKDDMLEKEDIKEYLIQFYNYLFSLLKDDYKDIDSSRKNKRVTFEPNIFYFYMSLAKSIRASLNLRKTLTQIIEKIDFDKNGTFKNIDLKSKYDNAPMPKSRKEMDDILNVLIKGLDINNIEN